VQLDAPLGHIDGAYHRRCLRTIVAGIALFLPEALRGKIVTRDAES